MFKKSLATALLVCTIPAMANAAWFLTTQVKSAGGTLTTSNGAQVVTDGVITKSYTAIADQTPTTALAAGYTLRGLNISDSSVDGTVAVAGPSFTPVDGHTYTVTAAFKVTSLPVTATNTGGTVSPSSVGSIYYGYKLTSPLTFTFAPKAGYSITDVLNVPAGAVKTVPGGVNQRATVSFPVGYVFTSSFNLQAVTVNTTPAINQILPQTVVAGSNTTVSASVVNVTSPVYNWTYVSGPANTATVQNVGGKVSTIVTPGPAIAAFPASAASVTFAAPSVPGQYKFQVKVGSLVKLATVNVVATAADSANQCQFCHTANGIDDSTIGTRYQASIHGQSTHAACSACHYGTANGGHPGSVSSKTVNSSTFLATVDGVVGANGNAVAKGAVYCSSCHNGSYPVPHSVTGLGTSCAACHTGTNGTNGTGDAHSIQDVATMSGLTNTLCENCHGQATKGNGSASIYTQYKASVHGGSDGDAGHSSCAACHSGSHDASKHPSSANVDPVTLLTKTATVQTSKGTLAQGVIFCTGCHNPIPHDTNLAAGVSCATCHVSATGTGGAGDLPHNVKGLSCTGCHSVPQTNPFSDKALVADNNSGVRAVTGEFTKWSHHIVNAPGVAAQDEQCAVCHLEGTVGMYGFGVDGGKHMTDNKIHLRNADTDADLQWDPASPNHSTMDTFCMSCHDANGATSAMNVKLQGAINALNVTGFTASAKNPFGDSISNRYDKMMRPAVTNVDSQFNTSNNSHHGVKGPRYSGRTRAAGPRQIASAATFANNSSAALQGIRSTMYDAGNFNNLYVPLADATGEAAPRTGAATLGDDSTLHCGDCHTVGQWAPNVATNAAGVKNTVAIGAHGSNNEYMLRNTLGTDERHTQNAYTTDANNVVTTTNPNGAFLVCYNCHAYNKYGSTFVGTGMDFGGSPKPFGMDNIQPHAGEYASGGRCNGPGNTIPFNGYTTGKATDGTQFEVRIKGVLTKNTAAASYAGEQNSQFGNIFGIQCLNCHNSGLGNAYGGIHGSANDTDWNGITAQSLLATAGVTPTTNGFYVDGMGNANKVERFLPGLGNMMHVPGTVGGFTGGSTNGKTFVNGGVSNDTNWEQKHWQQKAGMVINYTTGAVTGTASSGAGCYTFGEGKPLASDVTVGLEGPSVTGPNGAATEAGVWGGCDDHTAGQGGGNHGFLKRIVRPVTY
jgi:hypothetical protein